MCYAFFRLGKALKGSPTEDKIIIGLLLSAQPDHKLIEVLKPEWVPLLQLSIEERKLKLGLDDATKIFPYCGEVSSGIECDSFSNSFLIQPEVFIRIRPGYENVVKEKLEGPGVEYNKINDHTLSFAVTTKLDAILNVGKEVIIQDSNSQKVGGFLNQVLQSDNWELSVWDCCAASGGKSIMAFDINNNIKLTVSDIRTSILENLNDRFTKAGIKNYTSFVADLTSDDLNVRSLKTENKKNTYDLILADVPCTGSGTWARSPENLYYFNLQQIEKYAALQRKIVDNTVGYLSPKGHYLYSTCSVFRKENEEMVAYITKHHKLKLVKSEVLTGYEIKADTLFAALFIAS